MFKKSATDNETPLVGLEKFYMEFLKTRQSEISLLRAAAAEKNMSYISELAHQWKGFSAPFGFGALGGFAQELEIAALNSDQGSCLILIDKVEEYLKTKKILS
jgi:HPt (histidine-containing phosphotransfer) domain-containing protein